jgi:MFS family permease
MLPLALGLMPSARVLAPRLAARAGAVRTSALGLLLAAAIFGLLSRLDADTSYWLLAVGLVGLGLGMGLAMTPATATITGALPQRQQGVGSAVNDLARELGGALGIAVLGSVLTSTYRSHLDTGGLPAPLAEQARSSVAVATQLGGELAAQAHTAWVDGLQVALLTGCVTLVVAAALTLVLGRRFTPADED